MKKLLIAFSALVMLAASGIPASAREYHLFFIAQKQTFTVNQVDYQAWRIGPRYYMLSGDARPEGQAVYNVRGLLASAGALDMIYITVSNQAIAEAATLVSEYAGGGTSYGGAWIDFTIRSYEQVGVHSGFAAGEAARRTLLARWKVGGVWEPQRRVSDWIAAGRPVESLIFNVGLRVLGVD